MKPAAVAIALLLLLTGCGRTWAGEARCLLHEWEVIALLSDSLPGGSGIVAEYQNEEFSMLYVGAALRTSAFLEMDIPPEFADDESLSDAIDVLPRMGAAGLEMETIDYLTRRVQNYKDALDDAGVARVDPAGCDLPET